MTLQLNQEFHPAVYLRCLRKRFWCTSQDLIEILKSRPTTSQAQGIMHDNIVSLFFFPWCNLKDFSCPVHEE